MRFWESRAPDARVADKGSGDPALLLWGMRRAFAKHPRYWREIGKRRPRVVQFRIGGGPLLEWFVQIDTDGIRAVEGVHPAPAATWESDAAAYRAITREGAGVELLHQGRVHLGGDIQLLLELFVGMAGA